MGTARIAAAALLCMQAVSASEAKGKLVHAADFDFPNALPGGPIRVEKILDARTGGHKLVTDSRYVADADDLVRLEAREKELLRARHGALSDGLIRKLSALKGNGKLDVVVRLKGPQGIAYLDKTRHPWRTLKEQSESLAESLPELAFAPMAARHALVRVERRGKAAFRCLAGPGELESLKSDPAVADIEEFHQDIPIQIGTLPLKVLAASAYHHGTAPVPATAGTGSNAATFETGVDPVVIACFGIVNTSRLDLRTRPWQFWEHSQRTFRVLQTAAPGANLWHRNSVTYEDIGETAWFIGNSIQTTSLSYSRGVNLPYDATYPEFRVMDDFAYRHPFPVFVNGTANAGYQYAANWQGYNGISVGNVRHSNQTHFELVDTANASGGCTQTRNPVPRYGTVRDREMPQLVAPGWNTATGVNLREPCVSADNIPCGTSYSAPVVNGIAADILAADPRVQGWPETVRVILFATAMNVDRGDWSIASDGRDGAGVVHGAGAVQFAGEHVSVYPGHAAVTKGIATGSLYAADFASPNNPLVFNILIPNPKPAGMHLRVVLTWDSNPSLNEAANHLSDLDLLVTSGSSGRASQSFNGNNEVVDIPASQFPAGASVQARVSKVVNRIPASGTCTNYFYYAIGWTWVKDRAP